MTQVYLWLVAGVMLSSIPACSLDNWRILDLLRQLERIPTQFCLNDRIDFQCPWQRGNVTQTQKPQRTCVQHVVLQQIFSLFLTPDSRAAWNQTLLSQLLSHLAHSLERLQLAEEENLTCPHLGILIRKYFQGIRSYLKGKKYSCNWEVLRLEKLIRMCV
ncbi:interferon omega-1-like [Molossus molossus]|uniref:interferon omega-1-like n=1 Tax=Molossus molossus TaxID=27622 RepID=UPI0017473B23|nr:interferon omega-1-like [Molossus molossus]